MPRKKNGRPRELLPEAARELLDWVSQFFGDEEEFERAVATIRRDVEGRKELLEEVERLARSARRKFLVQKRVAESTTAWNKGRKSAEIHRMADVVGKDIRSNLDACLHDRDLFEAAIIRMQAKYKLSEEQCETLRRRAEYHWEKTHGTKKAPAGKPAGVGPRKHDTPA